MSFFFLTFLTNHVNLAQTFLTNHVNFAQTFITNHVNFAQTFLTNHVNFAQKFLTNHVNFAQTFLTNHVNFAQTFLTNHVNFAQTFLTNHVNFAETFLTNHVNFVQTFLTNHVNFAQTFVTNHVNFAQTFLTNHVNFVQTFLTNHVNFAQTFLTNHVNFAQTFLTNHVNFAQTFLTNHVNFAQTFLTNHVNFTIYHKDHSEEWSVWNGSNLVSCYIAIPNIKRDTRFYQMLWAMFNDAIKSTKMRRNHQRTEKLELNLDNLVVSTVSACVLAASSARASPSTVMTKFVSHFHPCSSTMKLLLNTISKYGLICEVVFCQGFNKHSLLTLCQETLQWHHNEHDSISNHQPYENIKALHLWPLWGKLTGDRWIPHTKDQ